MSDDLEARRTDVLGRMLFDPHGEGEWDDLNAQWEELDVAEPGKKFALRFNGAPIQVSDFYWCAWCGRGGFFNGVHFGELDDEKDRWRDHEFSHRVFTCKSFEARLYRAWNWPYQKWHRFKGRRMMKKWRAQA